MEIISLFKIDFVTLFLLLFSSKSLNLLYEGVKTLNTNILKVLLLTILLSFFINEPVYANDSFLDFNKESYGFEEVFYLTDRNIIFGYPDGEFKPQNDITRKQTVVMIGRLLHWNDSKIDTSFKDVSGDDDASGYIQLAYDKGIISGYEDGTFRPNEKLTRSQMAAIVSRAFKFEKKAPVKFNDINESFWAYKSIQNISSNGIVGGYPNGLFKPNESISRLHFSFMLSRVLNPEFRPSDKVSYSPKIVSVENNTNLNIRKGPSTSFDILGKIPQGELVNTISILNDWQFVSYNGVSGFLHNDYLSNADSPLLGKRIVIDAGHGGRDPGAMKNNLIEKEINLDLTLRLKNKLAKQGANVILTRSTDVKIPNELRADLAAEVDADIFISIHSNSSTSTSLNGTETYYNKTPYENQFNPQGEESKVLASILQTNMINKIKTKDNGIRDAGYTVLRQNTVPSVLLEIAYMSNINNATLLANHVFRDDVVEGIYNGIIEYFQQ